MGEDSLGGLIRRYRKRVGMSQFDLELEIETSPGCISRIENGLVNPTKESIKKIVRAFGLNALEEASLFDIEFKSIPRIIFLVWARY